MLQVSCKNTFLSFTSASDVTCSDCDSVYLSSKPVRRARSEGIGLHRGTSVATLNEVPESVRRLNVLLSGDIDIAVKAVQQTLCEGFDECQQTPTENVRRQKNRRHTTSATTTVDTELRKLKEMLGDALAQSSSPVVAETQTIMRESFDRFKQARKASSCSLTTMVSGDMSELSFVPSTCSDAGDSVEEKGIAPSSPPPTSPPPTSLSPSRGRARKSSGQKASKGFSHKTVPKSQDLAEMYKNSSKEEPPTTMMIRNIPNQYSQQDLMDDLNDLGFTGAYDFLYIPVDKATSASVGYAFVNFLDPIWAKKCRHFFQNYKFAQQQRDSQKLAKVSVAYIQGLKKNLDHYQNSAVNTRLHAVRRPVVMANIASFCR